MCCGYIPTLKWRMIRNVFGSITSTLADLLFGTYTRSGTPLTAGLKLPAAVAAYTSVRFEPCPLTGEVGELACADDTETLAAARVARMMPATVLPFQPPISQVLLATVATAASATGAGSSASARTRPVPRSIAETVPTAFPAID